MSVASPPRVELRLKQRYQDKIVPTLIQRFAYTNAMQVPRLVKVVANIGVGESISNPKALDAAIADLKKITGQQPVVLKCRPVSMEKGTTRLGCASSWSFRRSSTTRSTNCGASR
jgi:hypothetical protein